MNDAAGQASARLALRWGLGLGVVPVAGALLLLGLASVFPIRLDYRSFYDQRRLEGVGLPQAAEGFVYASADEGELNLRLVRHGLRGLSFPDRSVTWLVLGDGKAPAWADFAVDGAGGVVARGAQPGAVDAGAGAPGRLAERTRSALAQGAVVYDAPATRAEMEQRLPWLKAAACVVIARPAEALSALVVRRPASVFSWRRVARTASLVGTVLGVAALCALHRRGPVPLRWTLVAVAPLLAAALVVWSAALGTSVGAGMPGPWPYALWGATSALVVWRLRRGDGSCFAGLRPAPWWGAVAALAVGLLFLHVVRLDFDWDMHTHWLPMTRYLYRWGHHDPQAIMQCGGDIRAAAYPYGNAVLLAVFAWTADVPRQAAYLLGPETALAVLLYRGWVGFSYVALLLAVAGFMRAGLSPRQHGAGLAIVGVLSVMLVFPTAAGMPLASETMMLPFFGAAILLVAAGAAMGDARALILGGVLLGVSCFLKLEAGIILGFSVLPWLALLRLGARHPGRVSWRALAVWLGALAVAALPVAVWRLTVGIQTGDFLPLGPSACRERLSLVVPMALRALLDVVRDRAGYGFPVILFVGLPVAWVWRVHRAGLRLGEAVPVLAVYGGCAALVVPYVLAVRPTFTHVDTSYTRIIAPLVFSGLVYALWVVRSLGDEREQP